MAYPQTSTGYQSATPAFAGMDGGGPHVTDAAYNAESADGLAFGTFVKRGTAGTQGAVKLTTINDEIIGGVLQSHKHATPEQLSADDLLLPTVSFDLRMQGRMWFRAEETIAEGDALWVRAVVAGDEIAGSVRNDVDTTDCIEISGWATFVAYAAGYVLLDFDTRNRRA